MMKQRILIWLLGIFLILSTYKVLAQGPSGIQAIVNIPPPYSPYFSYYVSLLDNQIVTLRNFTDQTYEVKLAGSITSDVNLSIFTDETFTPPTPIVLGPMATVILMGNDQNLQYLDPENTTFEGDQNLIDNLFFNGILPEGTYTICIKVLDYITNEVYSDESFSCVNLPITYLSPPELIMPVCHMEVLTDPTYLAFSWTPPIGSLFGSDLVYDLYVVDVQDGVNPMDAVLAAIEFGAGELVWSQIGLKPNIYIRQPFDIEILPGRLYAWAVVARDLNERVFIANGGLSEICTFILPPEDDDEGGVLVDEPMVDDGEDPFSATRTTIKGALNYRFQEQEGKPVITGSESPIGNLAIGQLPQNNSQLGYTVPIFNSPKNVYFPQTVSPTGDERPLVQQRVHIEQVYMSSYVQNPTRPQHYFVIDDVVGKDLGYYYFHNPLDEEKLNHFFEDTIPHFIVCGLGTNKYTFFPNLSRVLGSGVTDGNGLFEIAFQQLLPMGKLYHGGLDLAPKSCEYKDPSDDSGWLKDKIFGQYLGGWRINPWESMTNPFQNQGTPMANVSYGQNNLSNPAVVNLNNQQIVESILASGQQLLGGTLPGTSGLLGAPDLGGTQRMGGSGGGNVINVNINGVNTYSYEFNTQPNGEWMLNPTTHFKDFFPGFSKGDNYPKKAVQGFHLYRAIRLRIENPQYCSPDIILLPVQGGMIILETETVLMNSYNLDVSVNPIGGPVGQSTIPGAFVNLGRSVEDELAVRNIMPENEVRRHIYGTIENKLDQSGQYVRMETGATGASGRKITRLVRHKSPSDQYYIEVGTYFAGMNNYHPTLGYLNPMQYESQGSLNSVDTTPFILRHIFNHQLEIHTFQSSIGVTANTPEIYGQIVTAAGNSEAPLEGVVVSIWNGMDHMVQVTGPDGIFHFTDLDPAYFNSLKSNSFVKFGYQLVGELPTIGFLENGRRFDFGKVLMTPRSYVKGEVRDEHGSAAMAEIKIGAGPYFLTTMANNILAGAFSLSGLAAAGVNFSPGSISSGMPTQPTTTSPGITSSPSAGWKSIFSVPAPNGSAVPIIIHPLSDKYFPDTISRMIPIGRTISDPFDLGTLEVKEKLHRPSIRVYRSGGRTLQGVSQGGKLPVPGAEVWIGDQPLKVTNSQGKVEFTFASPSNEFRIRIKVPGENHIPIDEYIVIPISKDFVNFEFEIKAGNTVTGVVREHGSSNVIANARVYALVDNHDYGEVLVETFTNSNGQYTLSGLPNGLVRLSAAKAAENGQSGYVGQSLWIFPAQSGVHNFTLKPLPWQLESIWGFPVEVTKLVTSGGTNIISGYLNLTEGNNRFRIEDSGKRVRFKDLTVQSNAELGAIPVGNSFDISEQKIRMILNDKFSCNASTKGNYKIKARKGDSDTKGFFEGPVETTLEFFNFSYDYNGAFNLHTQNDPVIPFLYADQSVVLPESYQIGRLFSVSGLNVNLIRDPRFSVHEFPARANRQESYVLGDTFYLQTILRVGLPLMQDSLSIAAGFIKVSHQNINIMNQGSNMSFNLEQWEVDTGPWVYDKNYGGLRATNATVKTGTINVTNMDITIKPNRLIMNNAANVNWNSLKVGGIAALQPFDTNTGRIIFSFVEVCHHDQKPHWSLSVMNEGSPYSDVAYITLPLLTGNQRINYTRFYQFSDGWEDNILGNNQPVSYHGHFTQQVNRVISGSDFFYLDGPVNLGIPGYRTTTGTFIWSKAEGAVTLKPYAFSVEIQAYGKVRYESDVALSTAVLNATEFSMLGTMFISDDKSPEVIALRSRFFKKQQNTEMTIIRLGGNELTGEKQAIGPVYSGHQRIVEGRTLVSGGSWSSVRYLSELTNFGNIKPGNDLVWMEVVGDIKRASNDTNQLSFSNVDVGFGSFQMVFNFSDKTMTGTLQINAPLPLGAAVIQSGTVQLGVGPPGFYLMAQVIGVYPVIGSLNTNFILGAHAGLPIGASSLLTQNMKIKSLPSSLSSGIYGFYLAANKTLVDFEESIDLGIFAAGVEVEVGLDARFLANFNPNGPGELSLAALAYAYGEIYARVLICDISVSLEVQFGVCAGFVFPDGDDSFTNNDPYFEASACASIALRAEFCKLVELEESLRADITFNSQDTSIKPDLELGGTCGANSPCF